MVALHRPACLLVSSVMATSTLFLAGVSPASADEIDAAAFKAAMADCSTATVALSGDVDLPDDAFDIACERTIDLAGFDLSVRRLAIGEGQHLTIKDSGTGGHLMADPNVIATGEEDRARADQGEREAGIRTTGAELTIVSGEVTVLGGRNSAGIGGDSVLTPRGDPSDPTPTGGTVVIDGGTVTATGGELAAGIGGGNGGAGGSVTINGGTVTATTAGGDDSFGFGAGIGGGYAGGGGTVTINGGTVRAFSGGRGEAPGIGNGLSNAASNTITVDGGTVVATSVENVALGGGNSTVTIGEGADVTASSRKISALGYRNGSESFGTVKVDGTLRLPSGTLAVGEATEGAEVTVGATGRIVGATDEDPQVGASITGDGQIDNGGSITLAPTGSVLDHHYRVTFDVENVAADGPDPVDVFAATFADGARSLPAGPVVADSTFLGWQLDQDDDGAGDGVTFDESSILPGTSRDGGAVPVTLIPVYAPDRAVLRPVISTADGNPVGGSSPAVGAPLTADVGVPAPAGAIVTYAWKASSSVTTETVGAGATYTPTASDLDKTLTVTRTTTGDEEVRTRTSRPTAAVVAGTFDSPTITIDGAVQVGKTVKAVASDTPVPAGTAVTGQWFQAYYYEMWDLYEEYAIPGATGSTLTITPAMLGYDLFYRETRSRTGYTTLVTDSPRKEVGRGQFDVDVALGDTEAAVGAKLSAAVDPDAPTGSLTYRWVVDGETVGTLRSYRPTLDDFGKTITVTVFAQSSGYDDLTRTSTTDPVRLGTFTDAGTEGVTISGTPKVGSILTAGSGIEPSPAPSSTTGRWYRGATPIPGATAPTYLLTAADVTNESVAPIRYEETRKLAGYTPLVSESESVTVVAADPVDPTGPTDPGMFTTGPTATITGIVKAGEELTASTGTTSPLPDRFAYQWFAGATAIPGATGARYTPTSAQVGQRISVEVTALREGYPSAKDRSSATAAVASKDAPSLSFATSRGSLRLGEQVDLTWTSSGSATVAAGGDWGSLKGLSGSERVKPGTVGVTTYTLSATNENGTTTAQVSVVAGLPAARFGIDTTGSVKRGRSLKVRLKGLAPGEAYTIRVGGTVRATGTASSVGTASRSIRVPRSTRTGTRTVSVTGSVSDRYGRTTVKVTKR